MTDKKSNNKTTFGNDCPDDRLMAMYIENRCSEQNKQVIKQHLTACTQCKEKVEFLNMMEEEHNKEELLAVPAELTQMAQALVSEKYGRNLVQLKAEYCERFFSLIRTTGEVLVGPLSMPAAGMLRAKDTKELSNVIVKEILNDIEVNIEVSRSKEDMNTVLIRAVNNKTYKPIQDLRCTIMEDRDELESQLGTGGKICFEEVKSGAYIIELVVRKNILGAINLQLIHHENE